ncbi:alpha/beta hydrolase [Pseudomonas sp. RA_35y_Pfl2_P32]|uniref:alpha/beta hydrolase n=1 Tax=Pseudomonas sp. RA_35y_Pfl2_P32 TaxID=3088705 RepID=UPI0030D989B3
MSRILMSIVVIAAALYLALCAGLWVFQRALIYYPQPRAGESATALLRLAVDEEQVLVSVRLRDGPQALIYFGGNAEDVSANLPAFAQAFPNHALYLMHYRGFGGSSGSPSEEGIAADALALFDQVYADHRQVVVVGRSLGSGVAVRLASQRPAARLILITPYNSLAELAARQLPIFPVRWLLRDHYDSWTYAARIQVPTLLLAAEHDEVIPRASTERLLQHFAHGVARLEVIAGTGHNSIAASPRYLPLLRDGM